MKTWLKRLGSSARLGSSKGRDASDGAVDVSDVSIARHHQPPDALEESHRRNEDLRKKLAEAEAAQQTLEAQATSLRARFEEVKQQRAALQHEVDALRRAHQAEIESLKATIETLTAAAAKAPVGAASAPAASVPPESSVAAPPRMRGQTHAEAVLQVVSVKQQADALFDELCEESASQVPLDALLRRLRSVGQDEASVRDLHRLLDSDGDGRISREEWRSGLEAAAGDDGPRVFGAALMALMAAFPTHPSVSFDDLLVEGSGCTIEQTEMRAITTAQLACVRGHVERRCLPERWRDWEGAELLPRTVTLYDATAYAIKPATKKRRCSFVELIATGAQRPAWFVSHWWGEAIFDFITCLCQHQHDRNLADGTAYWVRENSSEHAPSAQPHARTCSSASAQSRHPQ